MVKFKSLAFAASADTAIPSCLGFELWSDTSNDLSLTFGGGDAIQLDAGSIYNSGIFKEIVNVSDLVVSGTGGTYVIYYY